MAFITNTDSSTLPYNDDYMKYDLDRRMYVLTDEAVTEFLGYQLSEVAGNETKANLLLYRVSQQVYNFIRRFSIATSYKSKLYQIAKDADIREDFKQILLEQMLYNLESGGGFLEQQHGVNVANGKAMKLSELRGNVLISASAETILSQIGLLYTGRLINYNIEEDGTW